MTAAGVESIDLGALRGLNARAMAALAGRGAGKTEALVSLMQSRDVGPVAFDPAGQLATRLEESALVIDVPDDVRDLEPYMGEVVKRVRAKEATVFDLSADYSLAVDVVESVLKHFQRANVRDVLLVFEEAQRYIGQNGTVSTRALNAVEIGRNWRWGVAVTSQRPQDIDKRVLARCDTYLLGRVSHPRDVNVYREILEHEGTRDEVEAVLRAVKGLPPGHFLLMEPEYAPEVNA